MNKLSLVESKRPTLKIYWCTFVGRNDTILQRCTYNNLHLVSFFQREDFFDGFVELAGYFHG